ncbi:Sec63-domain-containing protein [Suillus clintonianus]|uniref:Sec63-domain-containing protein n=1 Tax=Suillus clintonianus TaxID=1904413 RepID=UPI001B85C20E|nr:Sec63-domain-containing protein [Suillus clintonianus]KAG2146706.1 Sec63-domain-containing protein [Suillus clintonianus]
MSILEHLDQLTSAPGEYAVQNSNDTKELNGWIMPKSFASPDVNDDLEKDFRTSITDIFVTDPFSLPAPPSQHLISRLLSKPKEVQEEISGILSTTLPDDVISSGLADLVGFDDIDIVAGLLASRSYFVNALSGRDRTTFESSTSEKRKTPGTDAVIASLAPQDVRHRLEETLRVNASRPLFTGTAQEAPEVLPHVYTSSSMTHGGMLSQFGSKYELPLGTTRHDYEEYEEVIIPPARAVPPKQSERLILVNELDELASGSFPGYSSLNRIQSIVYPTAYGSNENILVCAPTGAGKTDVAMLTILRVINQHRSPISPSSPLHTSINRDAFHIIYVAPMKALASEIVRKLGKRLQWLSIQVKELTGDMQLTKSEIAETQIIVTTPEKWDVVTRKPTGEGELASKLKLLIIDEVHLLNEERGAVIETIVARTLRQVESSQSVIRILGLSATLPNYLDVADFLSVSRYKGLFFFDSSFRPIPLEQHFIGVRGKPGSPRSKKNLDRVTFEKVSELVHQGHQVMVFVHARKETVKAAQALKDAATIDGTLDDYNCEEHPQWSFFRRSIGDSRNKEMKQLFDLGFGIHHAGMLRSDRNMMERMFEARAIKVLCCTATLAWGVNLPAHAVVIKGTQIYDSAKGSFVDLSVLDVLQVFGRAGRPGLETSGEGYICTTEDKLVHYLNAVTSQNPIESQFISGIENSLNAEIALGTVTNADEGVRWLGYTYLYVRMKKNPFLYGMSWDNVADDPHLGQKRNLLVMTAARKLASAGMINLTENTGAFSITDLGRIAARYYIRYASIEVFNKEFKPKMTEADALSMLSMSTEFDQIQVRESEVKELELLMKNKICDVRGGTDTSQGKVGILLQSYISRLPVEDFALVSDTAYVAQNGGRIARALLDIAISRKWARVATVFMGITKAIEKRLWPFDEPLRQFDLKADIIYGLQNSREEYSPAELASMTPAELGTLVRLNERHGQALRNAARQFPTVKMSSLLRPLGSNVLKIAVSVTRDFDWNSKVHDSGEPFWLWVEDHGGIEILQFSHLLLRESTNSLAVNFVVSIPTDIPPPYFTVRFVSERWVGAEDELHVDLDGLVMPAPSPSHTPRLDLPFLPRSSLRLPVLEDIYSARLHDFNAIQTQVFWSLINTSMNVLVCAPVSSGKSLMGHLAIWTTLHRRPRSLVLFIVPNRTLAAQSLLDFRAISNGLGVMVELSSSGEGLFSSCRTNTIRVVTPSVLLEAVSQHNLRQTNYPSLVVCDNLEQLDATYELSISLLRHTTQNNPTRYIGLSSSLNDPTDIAPWLGVDTMALHSFRPTDRDQSLTITYQTFTTPHSAALFKSMSKPAYAAIQSVPSNESAIIFVPSRSHCRTVAQELITQCALNMETERGFLPQSVPPLLVEDYSARLQDPSLIDFVTRGVGMFYSGMSKGDRNLVLELFAEGVVRVLLAPRDACWMLPVRAAAVVVMGTQYMHLERDGSGPQLWDYSLVDVVQMQSRAVRHDAPGHFFLFCQAEARDTFSKFLAEGLPLESELLESPVFEKWYKEKRRDGSIRNKQDAVQALSFTLLGRRLVSNPVYYDVEPGSQNEVLSRIVDRLEESLL